MKFVPLQWGKHCIDSKVAPYAFNFVTPLQHIFPTLIWSYNYRQLWISRPRHQVHLKPLHWLGCSPTRCGKRFQIGVKRGHISTSGNIMQLIFFFLAFYAFEYPLFYNHCNCEGNNIIVIPLPWEPTMGTYQGDPLERALFKLDHFRVFAFYN
jgi:hypothetical protein